MCIRGILGEFVGWYTKHHLVILDANGRVENYLREWHVFCR